MARLAVASIDSLKKCQPRKGLDASGAWRLYKPRENIWFFSTEIIWRHQWLRRADVV